MVATDFLMNLSVCDYRELENERVITRLTTLDPKLLSKTLIKILSSGGDVGVHLWNVSRHFCDKQKA